MLQRTERILAHRLRCQPRHSHVHCRQLFLSKHGAAELRRHSTYGWRRSQFRHFRFPTRRRNSVRTAGCCREQYPGRNSGRAIEIENSNAGTSQAPIYIKYNTTYGNNAAPTGAYCQGNGEISLVAAFNVNVTRNIVQTNAITGCSCYRIYGLEVSQDNSTSVVDANWVAGLGGNNTFLYASGSFAYGSANVLGTSPILLIRRFHRYLLVAVPPMFLPAWKA
jgi:hypothetical protein